MQVPQVHRIQSPIKFNQRNFGLLLSSSILLINHIKGQVDPWTVRLTDWPTTGVINYTNTHTRIIHHLPLGTGTQGLGVVEAHVDSIADL